MNLQESALLLMSIATSVSGQFFLKLGAMKLAKVNSPNALNNIISIATTPELLTGLTCYGLGAIAYILLLSRVNLSVAAPSISLVYVFSVLLGYFIFRETIPLTRLVGLSFIVGGVILVVWQK
ncbi:MAG: EamA family transporter [Nostoc sp.]|uniref:EamA family transporter n=1 Tax=unclassified Nostoc TaxID=2593658 RepID=UPI0025F2283E|nr:EamA family transporter [Nostoc sp. NMS9]MBN3940377.1 EamA family transporter [Nostoc sp. NMS9]